MPKRIEFEHDFFMNSITALNRYLIALFKPFQKKLKQTFPIGIINTGDEKFLMDMVGAKNIYDNSPRWSLDIAGINTKPEENTSFHELGFFIAKDLETGKSKEYGTNIQRKTTEVTFNTEVVFNNILEYFSFVEIYLCLTSIRHCFSFYHAGKRHLGIFELPDIQDDEKNSTFGFAAERRGHKLQLSFILQLQFPAYNIYGVPGSAWEGNNGFNDPNGNDRTYTDLDGNTVNTNDGTAGNGENPDGTENNGPIVDGEPMIAIIHNMHVDNPEPEGIVSTQIITKNKK